MVHEIVQLVDEAVANCRINLTQDVHLFVHSLCFWNMLEGEPDSKVCYGLRSVHQDGQRDIDHDHEVPSHREIEGELPQIIERGKIQRSGIQPESAQLFR